MKNGAGKINNLLYKKTPSDTHQPTKPDLTSLPTPSNNGASAPLAPSPLRSTGAVSASIAEEELGARLPRLRSSCRLIFALLFRLSTETETYNNNGVRPATAVLLGRVQRGRRAGGRRDDHFRATQFIRRLRLHLSNGTGSLRRIREVFEVPVRRRLQTVEAQHLDATGERSTRSLRGICSFTLTHGASA